MPGGIVSKFARSFFAALAAIGFLVALASPASAGRGGNGCIWINTGSSTRVESVQSTQSCGNNGYYHLRLYANSWSRDYPEFWYGGGTVYGSSHVGLDFPAGTKFCAQLWQRHDSGYHLWGHPCVSVP